MPNTRKRPVRQGEQPEPQAKQIRQAHQDRQRLESPIVTALAAGNPGDAKRALIDMLGITCDLETSTSTSLHLIMGSSLSEHHKGVLLNLFLSHSLIKEQINLLNEEGKTAFGMACATGKEFLVKILRDIPCDVNKAAKDVITPLQEAVEKGHTNIVNLLLADINTDVVGVWSSCLRTAIERGHGKIVEQLMEARAKWPHAEKPPFDAYELPKNPPQDAQIFLDIVFKHGICFKSLYAVNGCNNESTSWFKSAMARRALENRISRAVGKDLYNMPVGYSVLGVCYLQSGLSIDDYILRQLTAFPDSSLTNWLQGYSMIDHEKALDIALTVVHNRYCTSTKQNLPLFNKDTEQSILSGDEHFIVRLFRTHGADQLFKWVNVVISSPETFALHDRYQKIRDQLEVYQPGISLEDTLSKLTSSPVTFFYHAPVEGCLDCMRENMAGNPWWHDDKKISNEDVLNDSWLNLEELPPIVGDSWLSLEESLPIDDVFDDEWIGVSP